MNKASVKVIKRKDVTAAESSADETKAVINEEKAERHSRREMVNTVANWINERREQNRLEEITALRKIFGEQCLGEA